MRRRVQQKRGFIRPRTKRGARLPLEWRRRDGRLLSDREAIELVGKQPEADAQGDDVRHDRHLEKDAEGRLRGHILLDFEEVDREQRHEFVALAHLLLVDRRHLSQHAEHALLPLRPWRRRGVRRVTLGGGHFVRKPKGGARKAEGGRIRANQTDIKLWA